MVAPSASPTGFTPVDPPRVSIAGDGKLAAIHEAARVTILELPSGAAFAQIGVDPDANASEIGWVGAPGRLIVLSRYEAHSTVHLLDPHGPRSIAEIRLESPMRLAACVGAAALVVGPLGAGVLAATETHLTLYPFPTRSVPLAAGAAGAQVMVALPGSIEEWDLRTRLPNRRLRLPRVAAITAVGGSERVVWMTTQQEPARIDVIPLINRGQPRAYDLPEAIAQIAAHPRSDLLACVGAESGRMYVIDLDGRLATRVIAPDGIDRIESAALLVGRTASVIVAQAHHPITIVSLARRDPEAEPATRAAAEPSEPPVPSGPTGDAEDLQRVPSAPSGDAERATHVPSSLGDADDGGPSSLEAGHAEDARMPSSLREADDDAPSSPPSSRGGEAPSARVPSSVGGEASARLPASAGPRRLRLDVDDGDRRVTTARLEAPPDEGPRRSPSFASLLKRPAPPPPAGRAPSTLRDDPEPPVARSPSPFRKDPARSDVRPASFGDDPARPHARSPSSPGPRSGPATPAPTGTSAASASARFSAWRDLVRQHQPRLDPSAEDATPSAFTEPAPGSTAARAARSPALGDGPRSWRDEIVAWSRATLAGARELASPEVPAITGLLARFELAPELAPAVGLMYGAHLCGARGVAPVEIADLLDRQWDEALGRGELAARGLAIYAASRVALAPAVLRMLDELRPVVGTLVGEPGTVALLGPCVVVADDEPLTAIAARCLGRVGGAILVGDDDADRAALAFEARVYGAAVMLRTVVVDGASREPTIAVVSDAELAEQLGVPRLA